MQCRRELTQHQRDGSGPETSSLRAWPVGHDHARAPPPSTGLPTQQRSRPGGTVVARLRPPSPVSGSALRAPSTPVGVGDDTVPVVTSSVTTQALAVQHHSSAPAAGLRPMGCPIGTEVARMRQSVPPSAVAGFARRVRLPVRDRLFQGAHVHGAGGKARGVGTRRACRDRASCGAAATGDRSRPIRADEEPRARPHGAIRRWARGRLGWSGDAERLRARQRGPVPVEVPTDTHPAASNEGETVRAPAQR
jgi:hypothetical protein